MFLLHAINDNDDDDDDNSNLRRVYVLYKIVHFNISAKVCKEKK